MRDYKKSFNSKFGGLQLPTPIFQVFRFTGSLFQELQTIRHGGLDCSMVDAPITNKHTYLQNMDPGMPAFQRLMSVYSALAMVASGVLPGKLPRNPRRIAYLI